MADVPEAPTGVVDQESADDYLDSIFSSDEPPDAEAEGTDSDDESPSPTDEDGVARDEAGRFVSPEEADPDVAPAVEEPSDADAGPESDVSEEGVEPVVDGQLSDEEWDALPSMQYRADGQNWEIPGSKVEDDGVFIPTAQISNVAQLLAQGQAHQGSFRTTIAGYDEQVTNLTAELEGERAALSEISAKIEELVTTPGALEGWIEDQRKNWDTLKLTADLAKSKRAVEHANTQRETVESSQEEARVLPLMRDRLAEAIDQWGTQAGFSKEFQQQLYDRYSKQDQLDTLFPRGEDGRRAENMEKLREEMLFIANAAGRTPTSDPTPAPVAPKPGASVQEPVKPVRRKRRKAPTTVASSSADDDAPANEPKKAPKFKTTEEADAWVDRGGYNELE